MIDVAVASRVGGLGGGICPSCGSTVASVSEREIGNDCDRSTAHSGECICESSKVARGGGRAEAAAGENWLWAA